MRISPPLATAPPRAWPQPVVEVYVSAGSNIEPVRHLRMACRELDKTFGPVAVSGAVRSAAVGFDGPAFVNLVIGFVTDMTAAGIIDELERLHRLAGRRRGAQRYASRTLDLDLLWYGGQQLQVGRQRLPHPDIDRYGFVLGPLAELAADLVHPVHDVTIGEMWSAFDRHSQPMTRCELRSG